MPLKKIWIWFPGKHVRPRLRKLTELLYFKEIIENNYIKIFELNDRNNKENFAIIISMLGG